MTAQTVGDASAADLRERAIACERALALRRRTRLGRDHEPQAYPAHED